VKLKILDIVDFRLTPDLMSFYSKIRNHQSEI